MSGFVGFIFAACSSFRRRQCVKKGLCEMFCSGRNATALDNLAPATSIKITPSRSFYLDVTPPSHVVAASAVSLDVIAAGLPSTYRRNVDDCEYQRTELLEFWFSNSRVWFAATPKDDSVISQKFGSLLHPWTTSPRDVRIACSS